MKKGDKLTKKERRVDRKKQKKLIRQKMKKVKNHVVRRKKVGNTVKGQSKEEIEKYKGKRGQKRRRVDIQAKKKEEEDKEIYQETSSDSDSVNNQLRIQRIGRSDRTPWGKEVTDQFKGGDPDCWMNKDS